MRQYAWVLCREIMELQFKECSACNVVTISHYCLLPMEGPKCSVLTPPLLDLSKFM